MPEAERPQVVCPMKASMEKTKTTPSAQGETNHRSNQLRINFCVFRILAVTLVVVGVIGFILALFAGDWVHLFSIEVGEIGDAERKELLDKYNSRFSIVMSVVNKAMELAIQPLVAVALLCLGAKWVIGKSGSNIFAEMAPALIGVALGFLVCNGPTSLNVQVVPGSTQQQILTKDIQAVYVTAPNDNPAWNASLDESASANSALNTILRTRYIPAEYVSTPCSNYSDDIFFQFGLQVELPNVIFGYPESSWQLDTLPSAIEPKETFSLPVGGEGEDRSINATSFDSSAQTLYAMALIELYVNLGVLWGLPVHRSGDEDSFYNDFLINSRNAVISKFVEQYMDYYNGKDDDAESVPVSDLLAFTGDNFVSAAAMMLQDLLSKVSNVITDEVEAVYNLHQLADSVTYTSLTLRIPTRIYEADQTKTISILQQCGRDGCLIDDSFFDAANDSKPFVKSTPICEPSRSNCKLFISSLGKRISGGDFTLVRDKWPYEELPFIVATELRTTYSLTVGILNWTSEDLAATLNATCADTLTNCSGVRLNTDALTQQNKVLLAGTSNDSLGDFFDVTSNLATGLSGLPCDYLVWRKLVQVDRVLPMLLPRNFDRVDQAAIDYLSNMGGAQCSKQPDTFLNSTVRNHLFAEESLQMSYTAGLHYAFKNGVLHTTYYDHDQWVVDFFGNVHNSQLRVSIPSTNCILSIVGCCTLVVLSLAVAATHSHGKSIIEGNSSAPVLAEAMTNTEKFPRSLLKLSVEQRDTEGALARLVQLDQVEMAGAEFVEKKHS